MPTYSSTFDGSEDPLSESGVWTNIGAAEQPIKTSGVLTGRTVGNEAWTKYVTTFADNQSSEVTVSALALTGAVEVMVRVVGTTGYWGYWIPGFSDGYYLFRRDSGSSTQLAGPVSAAAFTVARRLRLDATGSTITLYDDDVSKISVSDATYTSGQPGLGLYDLAVVANTTITAWTGISTPAPSISQTMYTLRGSRVYQ